MPREAQTTAAASSGNAFSAALASDADWRSLDSGGDEEQGVTLCEALDRVLTKGVVVRGEVIISVANVDLIYLGVHALLASVDTLREHAMAASAAAGLKEA
ncbi:MAG: gas vesicle protein [Planctomycetota bacterium]|nr:gas vesicle protein [Planctomycetota bacterium]